MPNIFKRLNASHRRFSARIASAASEILHFKVLGIDTPRVVLSAARALFLFIRSP
jgi:hypothetical protein